MTAWRVTVSYDEGSRGRADLFVVEAADRADAEHAALEAATELWNPPRRHGVVVGTFRVLNATKEGT